MNDLITPHEFVDDCDCHQCSLRARDQLRTEVERLRNIEDAAVMCVEHPVWNDDHFYDLMRYLEDALRGEVGADKTANGEVRGASRLAGEASASTVVLGAGGKKQEV